MVIFAFDCQTWGNLFMKHYKISHHEIKCDIYKETEVMFYGSTLDAWNLNYSPCLISCQNIHQAINDCTK
uniref:Uncharacterized protein n=1 Tax=Rhizophora mucronata TaxID=61149 RepID=A0A2P2NGC0_RHIMU